MEHFNDEKAQVNLFCKIANGINRAIGNYMTEVDIARTAAVIESHSFDIAAYASIREVEKDKLIRELVETLDWKLIEFAPKNGEHIVVANFLVPGGWGSCREDGVRQSAFAVVHWWDRPGEEGWCLSVGGGDYFPNATHFKYLRELGEEVARARGEQK